VRVLLDCMDTAKTTGLWLAICFASEQSFHRRAPFESVGVLLMLDRCGNGTTKFRLVVGMKWFLGIVSLRETGENQSAF
jgi:hypothetical protein